MIVKIYKPALALVTALLIAGTVCFAQDVSVSVNVSLPSAVSVKAQVNTKDIVAKADAVSKGLVASLTNTGVDGSYKVEGLAANIVSGVNNMVSGILADVNVCGPDNSYSNSGESNASVSMKEKFKSYTKSYPLDAGDKIKLSNQYGKILVNTWDKHEVKVDVQIKAQAEDDDDAQKLLDGVEISDHKDGGQVTFRTEIERNSTSWKLLNFGKKKNHKVEINYIVYMPAKTDLNVEDSYGGIELPDLSGVVKISSSYGSVLAQNLSNPANVIEGSYGSLKAGSVNGARLDFSYGSTDIDECNNLKADLSYGSFKLGKLTGSAEFDISYCGGFKIGEMANSFNKLKIDASYSSVSLGVPGNNNFDFDITTTYGGFSYDDSKVTITSKTPSDSKHTSPTKNYKGHFGKESDQAQISIHSSYGGVNFE